MTHTIHIAAETEPGQLHGEKTNSYFGAHLAIEPDAVSEEKGRLATKTFLEKLPDAKFYLFKIDGSTLADGAELKRGYQIPKNVADRSLNAADTMEWLIDAKEAFLRLKLDLDLTDTPTEEQLNAHDFFVPSSVQGVRDMTHARAIDLMRTTAKWPAPLAQDIGLTVPVHVDFLLDEDKQYVLMYLETGLSIDNVTVSLEDLDGELTTLIVKDDSANELYRISTTVVEAYDNPHPFCTEDGRFMVPDDSAPLARLLARIEERAPSLLTMSTLLDDIALDPKVIRALAGLDPNEPILDATLLPKKNLHWLKQASVLTLFDVPLVGLQFFKPAKDVSMNASPRGAILQRLSRLIAGRFEAASRDQDLEVDETKLYANLHTALAGAIAPSTLKPAVLWQSITSVFPEVEDFKSVTAAMGNSADGEISWGEWRDDLDEFYEQLGKLSVMLESEAGTEAWVLSRTDAAFLEDDVFKKSLVDGTGIPDSDGLGDTLKEHYKAFRRDIEGAFNGAEALRRDFGTLVVATLLEKAANETTVEIARLLEESDWFIRRHDASGTEKPLDKLLEQCIEISGTPDGAIMAALKDAYAARLGQIVGQVAALKARFEPDPAPRPLPIRIASKINPGQLDKLALKTSGLGFIIRAHAAAEDGVAEQDETRHASLVGLRDRPLTAEDIENGSFDGWLADPAVLPTLPVLSPNSAGLFVQYDGTPLASPNRILPGQGGAIMDRDQFRQQQLEASTRGYLIEESFKAPPLPSLAYGRSYGVSAFWLPGSGVLPQPLQGDNVLTPGEPDAFKPGTLVPYLRRTAISDTDVSADTSVPEGVFPLSRDDPRLVLESFAGGARHVDLFRQPDGTGALVAPAEHVRIHQVTFSGGLSPDKLSVMALSADGERIEIHDLVHDPDDHCLTISLGSVTEFLRVWLRLSWKDGAPEGCLSFDDPAHDEGPGNTERQGSVLLIAPKDELWTTPEEKTVTLEAPRVSFNDFECWARNTRLWKQAAGDDDTLRDNLLNALTFARMFLTSANHEHADMLNRLPDPAVRRLVVSAAAVDEVTGARNVSISRQYEFPLDSYDTAGLKDHIPTKDDLEDATTKKDIEDLTGRLIRLLNKINERARKTVIVSATNSGVLEFDASNGVQLKVGKGWIVRLAANPGVHSDHFRPHNQGGVVEPAMQQLRVGTYGDFTLFDGPKLQIEVMRRLEESDTPAATHLHVIAEGRDRSYALDFKPGEEHRIFGAVQLELQQWRPSGYPIYRWIKPVPRGQTTDAPVVKLDLNAPVDSAPKIGQVTRSAVKDFESDAFIGHDTIADRKPIIRLQPAPGATRLWTQSWPERSATYFRHRLILRSRYASAAKLENDATIAQIFDAENDPWLARTVVLADALTGEISRPQMRAMFPVQQQPNDNKQPSTLPIGVVLSEPPYAQLGLADRICMDLRTINTYTFEEIETSDDAKANGKDGKNAAAKSKTQHRLRVEELRKQVGADPRLSYFGVDDKSSRRATLAVEGPVGLHFEPESVRTPLFPNSQYMMHVDMPDVGPALPAELEESFLGVSLMRYADPHWSYVNLDGRRPADSEADGGAENIKDIAKGEATRLAKGTEIPLSGSVWIEPEEDFSLVSAKADPGDSRSLSSEGFEVASVKLVSENVEVRVAREAVFKDGGDLDRLLCEVVDADLADIAVLVHALGDGRYALSVFRQSKPPSNDELILHGLADVPQLLASVELTVGPRMAVLPKTPMRITGQSGTTFQRWVRTARDLTQMYERSGAEQDRRIDLSALQPTLADGRIGFRDRKGKLRQIASPVALRRYPLHVHRRTALILRRPAKQIGHQIDLFERAVLADNSGQANVSADSGATVSVMELESRAEVLVVQDGALVDDHLTGYMTGHFDLLSTRGVAGLAEPIRQLRLHFRAANQPLSLKNTEVVLTVLDKDSTEEDKTKDVKLKLNGVDGEEVWSFEIAIFYPVNENGQVIADGLSWAHQVLGGEGVDHGRNDALKVILEADDFALSVERSGASAMTQSWLDVSLLHSSKDRASNKPDDANALDFDWIFGQPEVNGKLATELSTQTLNILPEAQARIVGHSAPMKIVFSET